ENNDNIQGNAGDDVIAGQAGNDVIQGNGGEDRITGDQGNDSILGGPQDDTIYGGDGADFIDGEGGDDTLAGQAGDDQIYGSSGEDKVYGGTDDDTLYGGSDNDLLTGDVGNDTIYGQGGVDYVYGGADDDVISGGNDNDFLFGQDGIDRINGNAGEDLIYGGNQRDVLRGGPDNDELHGGNDYDRLYGEGGADALYGEMGNDSLVSGVGDVDVLNGGPGKDRLLVYSQDDVRNVEVHDAKVMFRDGTATWTDAEMEVMDLGMEQLHLRTDNTRLLKDSVAVDPIVMIKETTLPVSQRLGTNVLQTYTDSQYNPQTGQYEPVVRYERQISFADWNEFDASVNALHVAEMPREFAHNWVGADAITGVLPNKSALWNQFVTISSWQEELPDDLQYFNRSGDNDWWYRKTAHFSEQFGTWNPSEDWGSIWKLYFTENASAEKQFVINKINVIDGLFEALEAF
ncbi:MAG: calcium-binding protein, partial [Planctomycetota bacterium]|nr:calcium-binding protein [Planctomycetota bacterium]